MLGLLDGLFLQKASHKPSRIAESSLVPEMEAAFFFFFDLIFGVICSLKQNHNKQKQKNHEYDFITLHKTVDNKIMK